MSEECVLFLQHAQYFKKHIRSAHYKGEKRFKCTACPFATYNLSSFRCHNQNVHGERKKTCVCEKCGYISYTRGGLKRNQESHLCMEKRKKYKCNTCPREFLNMRQLKKHVKVEHDKVVLPVKTFVCCNCDYTHQDDLHVKSVHEIINHV